MGRYVPPEHEGVYSHNALVNKHPLGARARKLKTEGILTVRFELPFAIWCTTCTKETIIGQGVRFNAEKKKVGNYFSTPIYSFRFKHLTCGGWIEIRTDPKNTAYVVTEGAKKRDTGDDKVLDGEIRIGLTEEEKDRLEKDGGFASLEGKVEDKRRLMSESGRLAELAKRSDRDWDDPYEQSKRLRRTFRVERKIRKDDDKSGEALKDRMGLELDLLPETEGDRMRAKYIDFGDASATASKSTRPLFSTATSSKSLLKDRSKRGRLKAADLLAEHKAQFQQQVRGNTRAAVDPFLREDKAWKPAVKVRRQEEAPEVQQQPTALVDYDSD